MNLDIRKVNPTEVPDWNKLVEQFGGGIFHTSNWSEVMMEVYNYQPHYFVVFKDERIIALVPILEVNSFLTGKRGVSLPFSDYCDVLIDPTVDAKYILDTIIEFGKQRQWKSLEFRGLRVDHEKVQISKSFLCHQVDIDRSYEKVYNDFRRSTKMNVKKALTNNITCQPENSKEIMVEFYKLNCKNKRKNGVPSAPLSFYQSIYDKIIASGKGNIFVTRKDGNILSIGISFHFGNLVVAKYMAQDYRYQQFRSNNILVHEMLKFYSREQNNWKIFCFGRTDLENKGLCQFKEGWGTNVNTIFYHKWNFSGQSASSKRFDKKLNGVFKKSPIWMVKLIGNVMYKHIG